VVPLVAFLHFLLLLQLLQFLLLLSVFLGRGRGCRGAGALGNGTKVPDCCCPCRVRGRVEGAVWFVADAVVDRARGAVEFVNLLVVAVGNRRADANAVGRWGR
jgi:hypothetical protein